MTPPALMTTTTERDVTRRYAAGAEVRDTGVSFRVWAPERRTVELVIEGRPPISLHREGDGYFSVHHPEAAEGALYRFLVDGEGPFPDPASRFQPQGPHGPSQVVDPRRYRWRDSAWKGVAESGNVIYEMHVGTFTDEGTWAAATTRLRSLRDLGITIVEVMPVAEFPGRFGWGYDGVNLWAPTRLYGSPDDFRAFVDEAHVTGLGVILDVVYNHFGPDGNYLSQFSRGYFTDRYENDWGDAINFDGPAARESRRFFIDNAGYWIDEFHLDGLRLDATQQIFDSSEPHILSEIDARVRECGQSRRTFIVAENEPQEVRGIQPRSEGGFGFDALWNDDFHHSAIVALTGRHDAYYTDYFGKPQEFISAAKWGFLYQGQRYKWQKKRRGTVSLGFPARQFVCFLENHDQVANWSSGERLWSLTDQGSFRAMTALLLLGPWTPMLFQGQEFNTTAPFLYFADHEPDLAKKVADGRREFLAQFRSLAAVEMRNELPLPHDFDTFRRCKLDRPDTEDQQQAQALHRDLLALRRTDRAFASQDCTRLHGAVLSGEAFLLRYLMGGLDDRLLVVNLGRDLHFDPAPEPLLAPPSGTEWQVLFSTESPQYGGSGTPHPDTDENWHVRGRAAIVLQPVEKRG
jgi:maltooligosyltrehalose trehalohydrolase